MAQGISQEGTRRRWLIDCAFLVVALLGTHGLWFFLDIFDATFDFPLHYRWAYDFETSLRQGILKPNWAAFSRGGLGDPVFLYYAPLFYYLVAAVNQVVQDLWIAMKIVVVTAALVSGILILNFARSRGTSDMLARLLAVLGIGLSSFLVIRGTINAYPWCLGNLFLLTSLIALVRAQEAPQPGRFLALALSVAAMSLTHTLTTAAFVLVVGLGLLLHWALQDRSARGFGFGLKVAGAIFLGLGLSAFVALPSYLATDLISPEKWDHTDIKGSTWFNSFCWPILTTYTRFALVWVMPAGAYLLLPFAVLALAFARPLSPSQRALAWAAAIAFFLTSELSYKLWELVTPLHIFQRPFRFLSPLSLAMLLLIALAAPALSARLGRRRVDLWALAVSALVLVPSGVMLAEYTWSRISGTDSDRYVRATPALMDKVYYVPEYLPASAGPGWEPWLAAGGWAAECQAAEAECQGGSVTAQHYRWEVNMTKAGKLRFPLMMFPGWQVTLNGQAAPDVLDPATGLVALQLPPGQSTVEVIWVDLPSQRLGLWVSLAALATFLGLAAAFRRQRG